MTGFESDPGDEQADDATAAAWVRTTTSYTCKHGSYLLKDGTRLDVESTHPRGRIRVTRSYRPL